MSDESGGRQGCVGTDVSVFGQVLPELQKAFAKAFNLSEAELVIAAKTFAAFFGESYSLGSQVESISMGAEL